MLDLNNEREVRSLKSWVRSSFFDCHVVLETNKQIVIQAPDCIEARHLCRNLRREGYFAEYRKGLKSDKYYVQVL